MDAAGNVELGGTSLKWEQAYVAGGQYTRLASSPPTLTNRPSLAFSLYSFTVRAL